VVAFNDGRQVPLPPGTGYVDENGKVCGDKEENSVSWTRGHFFCVDVTTDSVQQ